MLRIIIVLLISNLFSQNVENVFYDFSRHQGHTLNRGDLIWNEDWSSNGIFFDGTFSNFSSTYGPQIESNLFKSSLDSIEVDSIFTKSYFDYVQGDYFLDNLDLGINYIRMNRRIDLHAFKRRYAGLYNQYNNNSGLIAPVQYTYIGRYSYEGVNEQLSVSLGNFNSDFGLFDSTNISFLDSRITSSNVKYNFLHDSIDIKINYHNFLQRLDSFHSSSLNNGVVYLTRTKLSSSVSLINSKNFMYGALINFNKRSLDIDNTKTYGWISFNVFLKNKKSQFYLGANSYEDGQKLIVSGESNFKHNSFNSKLNAGRCLKPTHISFTDTILFEQKDHFWIENSFILNKSKIGIDFAFYKINRNSTYMGLPKNGFNNWMFFYFNHYFSNNLFLHIGYSLVDNLDYVSDGIKNRLKIKVENNFRLFSNAMSVHYSILLDGYLNRENEYSLSPVEKFPFKTDQISELKDLWIPYFHLKCVVKNVEITYEMNNVLNIIYDSLGKSYNDNQIIFNQYYPSASRMASLSIKWSFLN